MREKVDRLIERIHYQRKNHIYIYGAGMCGRKLINLLEEKGEARHIDGFCTSLPPSTDNLVEGVVVNDVLEIDYLNSFFCWQ